MQKNRSANIIFKLSKLFILTVLILVTTSSTQLFAFNVQEYYHQVVNNVPGREINCIAKISNGKLILGTNKGIFDVYGYGVEKAFSGYPLSEELEMLNITDICELNNTLYIGTENGLYQIDLATSKISKVNLLANSSDSQTGVKITDLFVSNRNRLWVGTNGFGAFTFIDGAPVNYTSDYNDIKSLANDTVYKIVEDENGLIWLATAGCALNRFNINLITFERISLFKNNVEISDLKFIGGNIYIATLGKGLFQYDVVSQSLNKVTTDSVQSNYLNHINSMAVYDNNLWLSNQIHGVFASGLPNGSFIGNLTLVDKAMATELIHYNHELWLGTSDGVLLNLSHKPQMINHAATFDTINKNTWVTAYGVHQFERNMVGTYTGELYLMDHVEVLMHDNIFPDSAGPSPKYAITCMKTDVLGNVWIGTKHQGLFYYDPIAEKIKNHFTNTDTAKFELSSNTINDLFYYQDKYLWVATNKGVDLFNCNNFQFLEVGLEKKEIPFNDALGVNCIFSDDDKNIWLGTSTGLWRKDNKSNVFQWYDNKTLAKQQVHKAVQDQNGLFFIGANNGLLQFNPTTNSTKTLYVNVAINPIKHIVIDNKGNVWFGSYSGLNFYNTQTKNIIPVNGYIPFKHGLTLSSSYKDGFGYIYLGTSEGLYYFDPDNFQPQVKQNNIRISNLNINGRDVKIGNKYYARRILKRDINTVNRLVLPRQARDISFQITGNLEYTNNINYAYRLLGYNKTWNKLNNKENIVSFTNLPFGVYHLQISNNLDVNKPTADYDLKVKIRRPIWRTWYFLLTILGIAIFVLSRFVKRNKEQMRGKLKEFENTLKQREQELNYQEKIIEAEKNVLDQRAHEEKVLRFHSNGLAEFSDELSKYHNDVDELMRHFIIKLVDFVSAHQGVVYKFNRDDDRLHLCGYFAESDSISQSFEVGEGYIGTVFKRGEVQIVDNIPESFYSVSSGLGEGVPGHLVIVPIVHNELKLGVVEISTFDKLEEYKVDFIKKVADNVASGMAIALSNTNMQKMLKVSQEQAEQLKSSEEEMRQNMEEMKATQENLEEQMRQNEIMQEELAKEKALLDTLLENIPDYVYFKDWNCQFIKISRSMLKLFPVNSLDEMVGKSDYDFQPKKVARKYEKAEKEIMKSGNPVIDDIQHEVMSNGVEQWVLTSKMPMYDKQGVCIGLFGITKDITELKKVEIEAKEKAAALIESEEELRQNMEEMKTIQEQMVEGNALLNSIMLNLPDYIYFKDKDSKFLRISNSMLKLFPVDTLEEMVGKSDFDFQPKETAQKYYEEEMDIIKSGKGIINDVQHEVMSNGVEQWVMTTKLPLINEMGECIGTFGVTRDITDIKKLEIEANQKAAALIESEEELRQNMEEMKTIQEQMVEGNALLNSIMLNLPDYIYFKDKDSKFLRISNSMLKLFPVDTLEEMVGKSDFDFQPKETAQKYYEEEMDIIKSGKGIINDVQHEVMSNGVEQWVMTTKLPLINEMGECIGTFGVTRDITDIKKLEIEAQQKAEELLSAEEELRQNLEEMQAIQEDLQRSKDELMQEKSQIDSLMDKVPDRIYFKDKNSVFLRVSHSMLKLFKLEKYEDIIGKSTFDLLPKEYADKLYADEKQIMETGHGLYNDIVEEKKEGKPPVWVSTTKLPLYNPDGECIGIWGITKDITEIKMMEIDAKQQTEEILAQEEELRQNLEEMQAIQEDLQRSKEELTKGNALLDSLMNNLPEYIYFKDEESRFIRISNSMLKLFPVKSLEEMVGKSDFDFQPRESAMKYYEDEKQIQKTRQGVYEDIQHEVMSNGVEQWVSTTKLPLVNTEGEVIGTFGITKDITTLKTLEIQAQEQAAMLEEQEEELRQQLEEMQATQEELKRSLDEGEIREKEYKKREKELQAKIAQLEKEIAELKGKK